MESSKGIFFIQSVFSTKSFQGDVVTEKTKMSHSCYRTLYIENLGIERFSGLCIAVILILRRPIKKIQVRMQQCES